MKRTILGIMILAASTSFAQEQPVDALLWSAECQTVQQVLELPAHYCACVEGSTEFQFPLETEISDTAWYTATVDDLKQGISAYWFADCSVTMDVYAFCTSKVPTFTLTVGPNQMRDIDDQMIQQKLDEMGETAQLMAQTLTPHIRVYPNNGGSGKVYCYPYDQGPESKCEDPLPLRSGMTYVCDKPENVYRMEWSGIPSSGKAFIHWKQRKNLLCEVWLTLDSCTGEEVGRAALSDSLHVYRPDSAMLVQARKDQRSLWMHVKHDSGVTGRVYWYNNPKYAEPYSDVNKKTCDGKTIKVNLRTYEADTAFVDLLWVTRDTLATQNVTLTFTQPELEYDTVEVTQVQLNNGYRYVSGDIFYEEGDYDVYIRKANTCTRHILLTLVKKEDSFEQGVENNWAVPTRTIKRLQEGQLIIIKNGHKYNVLGQSLQ